MIDLPGWAVVAANVAGFAGLHAVTGYAVHRLPLDRLRRDGWLLRGRGWERNGRIYRRIGITRWKDRLPEAGALFAGGTSKRRIPTDGGVERLAAETRRAELGHWLALAGTPLFVLWNPPVGAVVCLAYGGVANLPCILVQRYNRLRALSVLARRERSSGSRSRSEGPGRPRTNGRSIP